MGLTPSPLQSLSGGLLVHSSEALFAKELYILLSSLETASPEYGNNIACILAGNASENITRKVEMSLRKVFMLSKRRKKGVAKKDSAAA
jgi:hypothetical protein